MRRFKRINFCQNIDLKSVIFAKKDKIFECWILRPQTPVPTTGGGVVLQPPVFGIRVMCPRTPKHPPLYISEMETGRVEILRPAGQAG